MNANLLRKHLNIRFSEYKIVVARQFVNLNAVLGERCPAKISW